MRGIISSNAAALVFPIFQYQSGQNLRQSHVVMSLRIADYVTQVDVAVQDFLKKELYMLAPDIQFLGEETGLQRMNTDCYWILDPVDGTTNLMHDYQHSVVSLALCLFRKETPGNHNRCRYG